MEDTSSNVTYYLFIGNWSRTISPNSIAGPLVARVIYVNDLGDTHNDWWVNSKGGVRYFIFMNYVMKHNKLRLDFK